MIRWEKVRGIWKRLPRNAEEAARFAKIDAIVAQVTRERKDA